MWLLVSNGNFGGGNGTARNPYLVEDAHDLNAIRNYLGDTSVHFKQVSDIDLSSWGNWTPIQNGIDTSDNSVFRGTYDGDGYKILNMTCQHDRSYVGLFGYTYSATIKNVFIENFDASGNSSVGGLAGLVKTSIILNCYASGNANGTGSSVGCLVGNANSSSTISNCYASGSAMCGFSYVGGLVGYSHSSTISKCYASGDVSGGTNVGTGGLVGSSHNSTILNCYASGDVMGDSYIGGLVGSADGGSTISNCYASGSVSGETYVGGLIGLCVSSMSNCYALNPFIARINGSTSLSFSDITTDLSPFEGPIENCYSLDTLEFRDLNSTGTFGIRLGTPITEQEAKTLSTYTSNGWAEFLWTTNNDTSYPKLISGGYTTIEGRNLGIKISAKQAKERRTYEEFTGWDMESDWYIKEGISYPELIKRTGYTNWGEPGTHYMTYRYVIPHVDGTAQWGGAKWMHQKMFYQYPVPPAWSPIGTQVTYEVGNLEQRIFVDRENKEVDLVFIFSGVKDFKGAAGYAYYTDEMVRTVETHPERAAVVNFYFTEPKYLPTTNYKLSVSTPEGVVDALVVAESNASPIRFVADTGEIWAIPLVDTDDEKATPIHVATDYGIKAFKQYEPFGEIKMLEGDEWRWE